MYYRLLLLEFKETIFLNSRKSNSMTENKSNTMENMLTSRVKYLNLINWTYNNAVKQNKYLQDKPPNSNQKLI